MNRKALSLVMAGVLSASAVFPAFAEGTDGGAVTSANGTEVWAGIIMEDPDAQIKVDVPTLFAFVVNGAVSGSADASKAVTVADNGLLLPNIKVKVEDPTASDGNYSVQIVSDGVMQFTNYSTKKASTTSGRTGLSVELNGNIKNEGDLESRNYWEHVVDTAVTTDDAAFKKYNIKLDNNPLSTVANGGLELSAADMITLAAPINIENGLNLDWDSVANIGTNLAIEGRTQTVGFDVSVGATRGKYTQVEQSAKVGTIVWTISTSIVNNGYDTAPSNDFLAGTP